MAQAFGLSQIMCVCMSWVYINADNIVVAQFAVRDQCYGVFVSNVNLKSAAGVLLAIV